MSSVLQEPDLAKALEAVSQEFIRDETIVQSETDEQSMDPAIPRFSGAVVTEGIGNDLAVRPQQLREYTLMEKLGEGGMGAVYRAVHTRLEKTVAVKVLSDRRLKNSNLLARFSREMKAVGKLDHPNIVRATDAGEVDGTHFLAAEYVLKGFQRDHRSTRASVDPQCLRGDSPDRGWPSARPRTWTRPPRSEACESDADNRWYPHTIRRGDANLW